MKSLAFKSCVVSTFSRLVRWQTLIVCIIVFLASVNIQAQKKYALLIGLNKTVETKLRELHYACADVDSLQEALENIGYEVVSMKNSKANREDIIIQLNTYAETLKDKDSFILYFSGHGIRNSIINQDSYWMTYDAKIDNLDVNGIKLKYLLDYVEDIKAGFKLVLLDHCYSGEIINNGSTLLADGTPRGGSGNDTLIRGSLPTDVLRKDLDSRAGMIILAASRAEALELSEVGHGIFTYALLKALQSRVADTDHNGILTMAELQLYLNTEIPKIALTHAFEQQVADYTIGSGLLTAELVNPLPLSSIEEAEKRKTEYISKINKWYLKTYIEKVEKDYCSDLINKWYESIKNNTPLSTDDSVRFNKIAEHLAENPNRSDENLATDLKELVESILNP